MSSNFFMQLSQNGIVSIDDDYEGTLTGKMICDSLGWGIPVNSDVFMEYSHDFLTIRYLPPDASPSEHEWNEDSNHDAWFVDDDPAFTHPQLRCITVPTPY